MFVQSSWGKHIVYSLFGESHGPMIGITLHHLPAGIKIDMEAIKKDMSRRRPGKINIQHQEMKRINLKLLAVCLMDTLRGRL